MKLAEAGDCLICSSCSAPVIEFAVPIVAGERVLAEHIRSLQGTKITNAMGVICRCGASYSFMSRYIRSRGAVYRAARGY